ncbi:MAG: phosphoribosylglycinamide formyltransferase [Bacteroidales bacterium]|jgi:phosphoribosylglycinamide formyltransferase-1|nr:phosphoribosylglycinamide formyltransferase [Bacteroidales bacterium]
MKKIAIFASGYGSNFEAMIEAVRKDELHAELVLLVSDKPGCRAVECAKKHQINTWVFYPKNYICKEDFEQEIVRELRTRGIEWIVLAGYMRLVGKILLNEYAGRILNIHPSLLPSYPGLHAIERAYANGDKRFGITIHLVDAGMDTGQIIEQHYFDIIGSESLEEVEKKVHILEHKYYPAVVEKMLSLQT